jgi:hypothetical protein
MPVSHHIAFRILLIAFLTAPPLLAALFALLKVADVLGWPWLWILSPLWIAAGGLIIIVPIVALILRFVVKTGSRIP